MLEKSYISLGGRIILIKAALVNIPVYYMSMFKTPMKIVKVLGKSRWDFLSDGGGEKKMHLVKWKVTCHPKEHEGLGVGRLKDRNVAPVSKWIWRFSAEIGSFWHSIISSKYGSHSNGWDQNPSLNLSMSLSWRNIIALYPKVPPYICFVVGNGRNIRFWKDVWWND